MVILEYCAKLMIGKQNVSSKIFGLQTENYFAGHVQMDKMMLET